MNFYPFPILSTERLIIRKPTTEDCSDILFLRSDEEVNRFIKRDINITLKDAVEFLEKTETNRNKGKSIDWTITLIGSYEMIGSLCLWNFSEDGTSIEVGYALKPKHHNKGTMTEAIKVVLDYGFDVLKAKEITAYTQYNNQNSIKLLTKLGFKLCSTRKDNINPNNRIYFLLKS